MNNRKFVVEVNNLSVKYGNFFAVENVCLNVLEGEILGIIGENGAGKTTTVECISGVNKNFKGSIKVLDKNIKTVDKDFYNYLSVQLQEASFPEKLKVKEILKLFTSFYKQPLSYEEMLKEFEMDDKLNSFYGNLSGGQKQKLGIIVTLLSNAKIIILDELTTGLDPNARRSTIKFIRKYIGRKTIIMTTHFLDEIEQLCDRVCIISHGKVKEIGKLEDLYIKYRISHKIIIKGLDMNYVQILKMDNPQFFIMDQGNEISILSNEKKLKNCMTTYLVDHHIEFCGIEEQGTKLEDLYYKLLGTKFQEF